MPFDWNPGLSPKSLKSPILFGLNLVRLDVVNPVSLPGPLFSNQPEVLWICEFLATLTYKQPDKNINTLNRRFRRNKLSWTGCWLSTVSLARPKEIVGRKLLRHSIIQIC